MSLTTVSGDSKTVRHGRQVKANALGPYIMTHGLPSDPLHATGHVPGHMLQDYHGSSQLVTNLAVAQTERGSASSSYQQLEKTRPAWTSDCGNLIKF